MSGLPAGWALASIDQVAEVLDHLRQPINNTERSARLQASTGKTYPYFGATGQAGLIDDFVFDEDLVLLGEDGVPFLDPAKAKAYRVSGPCWVNNHAHVLRVRPDVADWRLACHALNALDYTDLVTGSTRLKLTQEAMKRIQLPLAPRAEQQRIADKLEAVLGRVDACRDRLDRVGPLLQRFRQSVLSAAVSGRLSEDDRAAKKWPAWKSIKIVDVTLDLRYGTSKKCDYARRGHGVLRIPNIGARGSVEMGDLKFAEFDASEVEKLALRACDLLVVRSNGSVDLVGRVAIVPAAAAGLLYAGYLMRLRVDQTLVHPAYARIALAEPAQRVRIERISKSTSGVNNINAEELRSLPMALPDLDEQVVIVRKVNMLMAWVDRLEARLVSAQTAADRLTPSVLAKAFRGELVPQDPADEPAQALLDRLRAARASEPPGRRRRQPAGA